MGTNLTYQILANHLVSGNFQPGEEIAIKIDQTLLQDATGTMAMLEFESLGTDRVQVELAAQYVDHNLLQTDHKNADDHLFLQTACARFGVHFSRPGNGISHQVHMERFGIPGKTLLGADSHTPAGAGLSMLAIGAGGLDVALAMAGQPYHMLCPRVLGVKLVGSLPDWVGSRDVILEMLRVFGVKGCVGKIVEYYGPGVSQLTANDRKNIGNMGTELGATTSLFPSDEQTRVYMKAEGRLDQWVGLSADPDADYDEHYEINLSALQPLIALPSSPGNVVPVCEVAGTKVDQVIVGSSANSSFAHLMIVADILRGRTIHPRTSLHINPGSRQVIMNLTAKGGLTSLLQSGAQVHQPGCLGCIGMGQAPGSGQVSLRTFPRNFPGRSGTLHDKVYLCSSETAAVAALKGVITDPRDLSSEFTYPRVKEPTKYIVDDSSLIKPSKEGATTEIIRGSNIRPFPELDPLPEHLEVEVILKVADNITTDDIMPAGNQVLPLRSNIEAISKYVYYQLDPEFFNRSRGRGFLVVVGGENYGQGSSREHAALAPRYLGVRVKVAKSFARIHMANLCNFGILPLRFKQVDDYEKIQQSSTLVLPEIRHRILHDETEIPLKIDGQTIVTLLEISPRQRTMILAGSALNSARQPA